TLRDGSPTPAVNSVQSVTVDPAGGAFALSVNGQATFNLEVQRISFTGTAPFTLHAPGHDAAGDDVRVDPNASVSLLQDALRGLYQSYGVSVARSGNLYTVTFGGSLAG